MEQYKRHTAYKFWIKDLVEAQPETIEGTSVFKIKDKQVARVNVLANIIHKYINPDKTYAMLILDDGSSQIKLKAWGDDVNNLEKVEIGNCILVIGRLTHLNGETFIRPEIAKVVENMEWELVRKLELNKMFGKPEKSESKPSTVQEVVQDEEPVEPSIAAREKIMNLIENNSGDNGIEIAQLIKISELQESLAESVVEELLKEGEAYQPKQGFVKLI